jgi:predicted nuclease of predicted toxin-antitoxin system
VKFLVDEDVAIDVARCLRNAGHEVALVAEVLGVQTDDVDIWRYAVRTESVVVTCNRQDFLALAGSAPETGVIIRRRTRVAECQHILRLLTGTSETGLRTNINFA